MGHISPNSFISCHGKCKQFDFSWLINENREGSMSQNITRVISAGSFTPRKGYLKRLAEKILSQENNCEPKNSILILSLNPKVKEMFFFTRGSRQKSLEVFWKLRQSWEGIGKSSEFRVLWFCHEKLLLSDCQHRSLNLGKMSQQVDILHTVVLGKMVNYGIW